MQNFADKVIVISGGASGIGLAIAKRAVRENMRVVIADIDRPALDAVIAELGIDADRCLTHLCDVTDLDTVKQLATATMARFGQIDILINNAGVGAGGVFWEIDPAYWNWVVDINLKGVFHFLHCFVPLMIAGGSGHIVNTASVAGLMSSPGTAPYTVSKHGVVAMSEVLAGDLRNAGHDITVSVLCPSIVNTRIHDSQRLNPDWAKDLSDDQVKEQKEAAELAKAFLAAGLSPDEVADLVFEGITQKRFYILTHPEGTREQVTLRMNDIVNDGTPRMTGPEQYPM